MRAVLLSTRAKYCELIASGKKIIEVRKTRPKIKPPFKCYIYCTKRFDKSPGLDGYFQGKYCGKVIGEFICDNITRFDVPYPAFRHEIDRTDIIKKSCMRYYDLHRYAYHDDLFAWNISEIKIYNIPKEISDFGLKRAPQSWCYVEELG